MELDETLRRLRTDEAAAPGMVVMITTAESSAVDVSGLAVLEHEVSLTAETRIYAASLAKLVTALCVHRLAIDGHLSLDEPVSRWFPALVEGGDITVRHLLLHRSGLPEYHALRLVAGHTVDDRLEQSDVRRLIDGMSTWFQPGSRVSYNNTNFAMLAMVVSDVSGQPFGRAAAHLVFEPADMHTALVKDRTEALVTHAAAGYTLHSDGFRRAVMGLASVGDGGLWWSVNDLAAMGRLLLGDDPAVSAMRERVPLPDGTLPTLASGCTVGGDGAWFGGSAEFTGFVGELRVYDGVAIGAMANRQDAPVGARLDAVVAALGLPEPAAAPAAERREGPAPDGVMIGVGGASWSFAAASNGRVAVGVGGLTFHLIADGIGWRVVERDVVTGAWEDDDLVMRDDGREIARLRSVSGDRPGVDDLVALAGWWWCAAAQAAVRVTVGGDEAFVRRGQLAPERLLPVGERDGHWVLAAPWGLLELHRGGRTGRIVLGRAEGLAVERLVPLDGRS